MKTTIKKLTETFNITKGELYVHSFDDSLKRYSTYGGLDILKALNEIMIHLRDGRNVIVTNKSGDNVMIDYEIHTNQRIPYDELAKYSVTLRENYGIDF